MHLAVFSVSLQKKSKAYVTHIIIQPQEKGHDSPQKGLKDIPKARRNRHPSSGSCTIICLR